MYKLITRNSWEPDGEKMEIGFPDMDEKQAEEEYAAFFEELKKAVVGAFEELAENYPEEESFKEILEVVKQLQPNQEIEITYQFVDEEKPKTILSAGRLFFDFSFANLVIYLKLEECEESNPDAIRCRFNPETGELEEIE